MMVVNGRMCFWFGNELVSNFMKPQRCATVADERAVCFTSSDLVRTCGRALCPGNREATICTVEVDGQLLSHRKWLAIGAGTLEDVGLGFRALYRAVSHPGTIHF